MGLLVTAALFYILGRFFSVPIEGFIKVQLAKWRERKAKQA